MIRFTTSIAGGCKEVADSSCLQVSSALVREMTEIYKQRMPTYTLMNYQNEVQELKHKLPNSWLALLWVPVGR